MIDFSELKRSQCLRKRGAGGYSYDLQRCAVALDPKTHFFVLDEDHMRFHPRVRIDTQDEKQDQSKNFRVADVR